MSLFRMCADCNAQYHNPANRRFHAQPNACPVCGPTVVLARSDLLLPDETAHGFGERSSSVLNDVQGLLRQGETVAMNSLGGFQLACDAENDVAVRQLRSRKKRSDKPFALMVRDIAAAAKICRIS